MIKPLSPEAIKNILLEVANIYYDAEVDVTVSHTRLAQEAQRDTLRQVAEWGIEICTEHLPKWQGHVDLMGGVLSRRECPKCWQELKEQVK